MNVIYDTAHKTEVILRYLVPALGCLGKLENDKLADLVNRCRFHSVLKNQILESPGPRQEGYLWFTIQSFCQSYNYNHLEGNKSGTRIWQKREFIFYDWSLLDGELRGDSLQILESGDIISISYQNVIELMDKYDDIREAIKDLSRKNAAYYHHRNLLLNLPPALRVKQFREENRAFVNCFNQEIQAMHVNLSVRAYYNQLKKLQANTVAG
ncbi:hypothetical protein LPB86_08795 [Pedobacter sp. MC2016-14]|uniref:hypothetical protein n=1 Tax=Pedobacter sp. MC2016-14 TaxID=2897327 RepID=UPI001E572294|nr:hypothetical protein [Pedobacter sp. MC2016-14]MCD0488325.1 hypothetical protein [Pedobacter sp. MC2016-14]